MRCVREHFGLAELPAREARFEADLRADSLDAVELLMRVENEFSADLPAALPNEGWENIRTVGEAVEYVAARLRDRGSASVQASVPEPIQTTTEHETPAAVSATEEKPRVEVRYELEGLSVCGAWWVIGSKPDLEEVKARKAEYSEWAKESPKDSGWKGFRIIKVTTAREEVFADGPKAASGHFPLPKEPPPGLLMSMAIRMDHGLGVPGYYDQDFFRASGLTHQQRLEAALVSMRQLYEEVAGYGFHSAAREAHHGSMPQQDCAPISALDSGTHTRTTLEDTPSPK